MQCVRYRIFLFVALGVSALAGRAIADEAGPNLIGVPVIPAPAETAPGAPTFVVNENALSYHYELNATNPGAGRTPKDVFTFTHFDVWTYGTNFLNVDGLKATNGETTPAAPCGFPNTETGCSGYTEIYGLERSTLGLNQLTGTKNFSTGPLTNVSLLFGFDLNTDNTNLASAKRSIEGGVQFNFAMPYNGFFNTGFVAYKEWQHDGIAAALGTNPGGSVNFNPTWGIEVLYEQPLGFLPPSIPVTFNSLITVHGPKGAGEPDAAPRIVELYSQQSLSLDIGQVVGGKPDIVSIWVAYRDWLNKFGLDPVASGLCCTHETQFILGATVEF
jgi:hypothetical protein